MPISKKSHSRVTPIRPQIPKNSTAGIRLIRMNLKLYPNSKLVGIKLATAVKAEYKMAWGMNHPLFTANSPNKRPPITEKEPERVVGVFKDAIFNPSMANSMIKNCKNRGTAVFSVSVTKFNPAGKIPASRVKRSHTGIK